MKKLLKPIILACVVAICAAGPVFSATISQNIPVYGHTDGNLNVVYDFLEAAKSEKVSLTVDNILITPKDGFDWISVTIKDDFWLLYRYYYDESKDAIKLQTPNSSGQQDEALSVFISSMLNVPLDEANSYLATLRETAEPGDGYFSDENYANIDLPDASVAYNENKYFQSVEVERFYGTQIMLEPESTETAETKSLVEIVAELETKEHSLRAIAENRLSEYWKVSMTDFSVVWNEDYTIQQALFYMQWDAMNGTSQTRTMLEMYSDDLALSIANNYKDAKIKDIWVFWKVPYLHESANVAKYKYSMLFGSIYRAETLGMILYGKE